MDTLRLKSIDVNLRVLSDYVFYKALGVYGFDREQRWLYSYFNPTTVRNVPAQHFLVQTRLGSLGVGEFEYPAWHKQPKEDIVKAVGLQVEYLEPVDRGVDRVTHKTVGDAEHAEIVQLYAEGLSFRRIGERLNRSSRTAKIQLDKHNAAVESSAYCIRCRRARGDYEAETVTREVSLYVH